MEKNEDYLKVLKDDNLFNSVFKTLVGEYALKNTNIQLTKPAIGKLMWKQKEFLARDTKISPMGQIVTEIIYKIPVVFEKENPGPIKIGRIIISLENMFDRTYSNFLNIAKCSIHLNDNKYYIKIEAAFSDYSPLRREK